MKKPQARNIKIPCAFKPIEAVAAPEKKRAGSDSENRTGSMEAIAMPVFEGPWYWVVSPSIPPIDNKINQLELDRSYSIPP